MCGRFAATARPDQLVEEFDIEFVAADVGLVSAPRWNVAPTDPVATILVDDLDGHPVRQLAVSRWGLTPPWAKTRPMTLINARVETVNEKPSFKRAIRRRRCLVPAAGYYEWIATREEGRAVKQPYYLHPPVGSLAMAGIYEYARDGAGWLATTCVLTASSTDEFGWVHDRMPLCVPPDARHQWLDPAMDDGIAAVGLLAPPHLERPRPVSRAVNRVGTEGPQLIDPVPE